jgi:hypothetical protein
MTIYEGIWHLVPDLSHYSAGTPPQSGRYEIAQEAASLNFRVDWVMMGQAKSVSFSAPADGADADFPGLDRFYLTLGTDHLDSTAEAGGRIVAFARRRVSADGALMSVYQENQTPEGPQRIFQVYRREPPAPASPST